VNKPDKSSIFKTSLLVALLGSVFGAQAAGLGKLTVYSAIGQPLNAEVALSATAEELNGLSAKLASHEAFKDAGIEFMPALTGLRMNVGQSSAGQPILRLTTDSPLNEPFLHFLVELNWTAGRMVREYTFLLDPPEILQVAKPASVVAPLAPTVKAIDSVAPAVVATPPLVATPRVAAAPVQPSGEVRVKPGDTLSKIARENKPETVTLDQMLVALFNGNRDAFMGNNMNRLRAGKILKLPDEATVAQVEHSEARRMIVSQAADFNAYRRRLAEAAIAVPAQTVEPQQSATGKIKPQIEQKPQSAPAADKLEVSQTESGKKIGGIDQGRLEEELIARDKALREASERIAQLEKNLENLKRLAELKSEAGAQLQQQAQVSAVSPAKTPELQAAAPAAVTATPASPPVEAAPAGVPAEKPEVKPETKPETKPVPKAPTKLAPKPVPLPPPPVESDFIAENPQLVFGGGGIVALLLGYLGYNAWRRKKQSAAQELPEVEPPSFLSESPAAPQPAVPAGASVAPSELPDDVSILGDFSHGALTTEESADPVAEADVLMAYGRDGQAEEILLEGLKSDPGRSAIHLKLMELYANRKDVAKFEAVAKDLHVLSRGEGAEWTRATALARDLGVTGALFAAASPAVAGVQAVAEIAESTAPAASVVPDVLAGPADVRLEAAIPDVPVEHEADSLDFDLDLGTTSMPAAIAAAEAAQPQPASEAMSLDFDFDLGTPSIPEQPAPDGAGETVAETIESAAAFATQVAADDNVIDFSLDIGDVADEAPPVEDVSEPVVAVDETASQDIDFDLGLDLETIPASGVAVEEGAGDAGTKLNQGVESELTSGPAVALEDAAALDFDLGLEDALAGSEEGSVSADAKIPDLGLSDISLDLDAPAVEASAQSEIVASAAEPDLELPDLDVPVADLGNIDLPSLDLDLDVAVPEQESSSGDDIPLSEMDLDLDAPPAAVDMVDLPSEVTAEDPEVATKLELAQAYEEMGDREGARELLNEVLNEGSAAQQSLARARLDQLDA
jgi:pilus assembly protein FimV